MTKRRYAPHISELFEIFGHERLFSIATDELRTLLDARRHPNGHLRYHDFVIAARIRARQLGIDCANWDYAQKISRRQNEELPVFSIFLTDAHRAGSPIARHSPNDYLLALLRAWQQGKIDLFKSLTGLPERHEQRDV